MIRFLTEAVAFSLVVIIMFNMITQFLLTLGIYQIHDAVLIGFIAVLLAVDNILSQSFFGYQII